MLPSNAVFDTGSGMNIVKRDALFDGWETLLDKDATMPRLGDANGRPLRLLGEITLRIRFGNTTYRVPFVVAEKLAVNVIIGTRFMNRYVDAIECRTQTIRLLRGATIPILSRTNPRNTNTKFENEQFRNETTKRNQRDDDTPFNRPHTVRLAKHVTIPPLSQMSIPVVTTAAGLVYLEPTQPVQTRHHVRTSNGVIEVRPGVRFDIVLANFSKKTQLLPKGMTMAYAKRNPLAILTIPKNVSTKLEAVLNLPFTTAKNEDSSKNETDPNEETNTKERNTNWRDTINLEHVDDHDLRTRILTMLTKHEDMWTSGRLGEIAATEHRIELTDGTKPIRSMPYQQGPATRTKAEHEIRKMLDAGFIKPATSKWASPIVLVPKKDGSLRFCVAYRRLDAKTIPDAYPLPRIDDFLDSLGDAEIFTTLECNAGYWQVPVAPEDRDKTTFTLYLGTFRYTRMPFGLRNAPATFQRAPDIILSGVRWQSCLIYLDDVIVFSRTTEDHLRHVDEILTLPRNAGVTLKLKKCAFFQPRVDYLGHVIMPGKLSVATENTKSFTHATFPKKTTQLRSFLGAANVYRRFVAGYSAIARPLNGMLRKDADPDCDSPTPDQLEAFETLKRKLVTPQIRGLPKTNKPYMIDTDASAYQLGATLLQKQNETKNEWTPIGYWSKTLTDKGRNYSTTERECYSVVWAVTTLRPYIERETFTVRTEHDALRWLMTLTDSSGRLMRWRLRLSEFDFTIQYRPGIIHQVPDALSRLISPRGNEDSPVDDEVPTYGDHGNVLVTTRTRARAANAANETKTLSNRTPRTSDSGNARKRKQTTSAYEDDEQRLIREFEENVHGNEAENEDETLDEVLDEDLVISDLAMAYRDDGRKVHIADVSVKITRDEVLDAQRYDDDTRASRPSSRFGVFRRRLRNTTKTTSNDQRTRTNRLTRNVTTSYTRSRALLEIRRPPGSNPYVSSLTRNVLLASNGSRCL